MIRLENDEKSTYISNKSNYRVNLNQESTGVCGFDFRVDLDGNVFFLEANPRFSGGVRSQILCGFDQPYLLWRLASGLQAGESRYRVGRYTVDAADAWKCIGKKKY